jgi:hypothetical protein
LETHCVYLRFEFDFALPAAHARLQGWWSQEQEEEARSGYRSPRPPLARHVVTALVCRRMLHSCVVTLSFRAAILKALSEAEALKKPSVSATARRRRCSA